MPTATETTGLSLRTVTATRYVTPLREGGSLPGLLEADDDGLYVVKFRAAGQGPKALVAELIAGELGRAIGLPVPEIVLVELAATLGHAEPDPEIQDLLVRKARAQPGDRLPARGAALRSGGGSAPGATGRIPSWRPTSSGSTRSSRTSTGRPKNVNLLVWHGRLWLIDHGAALYVQHTWRDPAGMPDGRSSGSPTTCCCRMPDRSSRPTGGWRPGWTRTCSSSIVGAVPTAWLGDGADAQRVAYVDYLMARLEARARSWRRPSVPDARRSPFEYAIVRVIPRVDRGE